MNDFSRGDSAEVGAASSSEANTLEITVRDENRTASASAPLTSVPGGRSLLPMSAREFYLAVLRGEHGAKQRPRSSTLAQTAALLFLSLSADSTGLVTATNEQIARGIQLSVCAVKVAVCGLAEAGAIKVVRRSLGGTGATYKLPVPASVEKA